MATEAAGIVEQIRLTRRILDAHSQSFRAVRRLRSGCEHPVARRKTLPTGLTRRQPK